MKRIWNWAKHLYFHIKFGFDVNCHWLLSGNPIQPFDMIKCSGRSWVRVLYWWNSLLIFQHGFCLYLCLILYFCLVWHIIYKCFKGILWDRRWSPPSIWFVSTFCTFLLLFASHFTQVLWCFGTWYFVK